MSFRVIAAPRLSSLSVLLYCSIYWDVGSHAGTVLRREGLASQPLLVKELLTDFRSPFAFPGLKG